MISSFYTSLSGLHAQRRILDAAAHNVANEATPGYHRQRVELQAAGVAVNAGVFAGHEQGIRGVDVVGVDRIVDQLAENRLLRESANQGGTSTLRTNLVRIERAFPEPSEDGLAALLDDFWGGWSDLSTRPDDPAARGQLLERAQTLADGLRRTAAEVQRVADSSQVEIVGLSIEANDVADRIAQLNQSIIGSADSANDLRDQRDLLVRELAALTGAVGREQDNGQVDVYIGGRAIVSGSYVNPLDGSSGSLQWADGLPVVAPPSRAASLTATVDDIVPGYISMLDGIAASLVGEVNTLHTAGYDLVGATGWNFFDPAGVTASSIALSADVDGQPDRVAAGAPVLPGPTAPGPLDGEQARALAAISGSPTGPGAAYQLLVSNLGVEVRSASRQSDVQDQVVLKAEADVASVGGVSLDEEMATLVAAQRAYEASARVLTTVDAMLETLIERTGRVGR